MKNDYIDEAVVTSEGWQARMESMGKKRARKLRCYVLRRYGIQSIYLYIGVYFDCRLLVLLLFINRKFFMLSHRLLNCIVQVYSYVGWAAKLTKYCAL